jgi:hypothetical protein
MSPVGASYKSTNKADFKKNRFKNILPCFQKNRRQENRPDKAVLLIEFQIIMNFFSIKTALIFVRKVHIDSHPLC